MASKESQLRSSKVHPLWSKNLKEGKEDFDYYVANSRQLLLRLDGILDEFIQALDRSEDNEDYAAASWPYLQADRLGQKKAFNQLKRIIKGSINSADG